MSRYCEKMGSMNLKELERNEESGRMKGKYKARHKKARARSISGAFASHSST